MTVYRILYRGSLSSCNYDCSYCPFAKTTNTRAELERDAKEVCRFVDWIESLPQRVGVFFTPWGEAIVHSYYRRAMIGLSHLPHVDRVVMQTNLGCNLSGFSSANAETLRFWATYHPTQTTLHRFLNRCRELEGIGIGYSVGVVGLKEHFSEIQQLRQELSPTVYLWINSYKRDPDYYHESDLDFLRSIDPYFDINRHYYPSQGRSCRAGETSFTVDGVGDVRRCHFIDRQIGNIYEEDIFQKLRPQDCSNATCGCHIGYVHQNERQLYSLFGENVLERIPDRWPEIDQEFTMANHCSKTIA